MELQFTKMQGCGNDFVIIDNRNQQIELNKDEIKLLCDRNYGIGCDQLVLINNNKIDALSMIVHKSFSTSKAREIAKNLQKLIPRQMFDVPIQVALGAKIISRETVKAYRKNVTAKLYGGDVTRKMKLLEKQKQGKKKMKQLGKVSIPQDAFLNYFNSEQ